VLPHDLGRPSLLSLNQGSGVNEWHAAVRQFLHSHILQTCRSMLRLGQVNLPLSVNGSFALATIAI
jgi:hypothetical protein